MNKEKAIEHCRRMIDHYLKMYNAFLASGKVHVAYQCKGQVMAYADMIIRIDSGEWD